MNGVNWIEAEGFLVVILEKKTPKTIKESSPIYKDVKAAIKENDRDKLVSLLFPEDQVKVKSSGRVSVDSSGAVSIEGRIVDSSLSRLIKDLMKEDLPFDPLVKLNRRIEKNENEWVRNQLFRFLERNRVSLTDDGCFICYKGVKKSGDDLVDCYTGKFLNNIGCTPSLPREEVDLNPHHTCSRGLHVAAHGYVRKIYGNNILVAVKVDPKDVCSVPYDYDDQKMRVCRYKVIAMMGDSTEMEHVYFPWDKSQIKSPAKKSKVRSRPKKGTAKADDYYGKKKWVDLSIPPASMTIDCVLKLTGKIIPISRKSKIRVIKYALDYLSESGYKTDGESLVEIPVDALRACCNKKVSISGKSSREIVQFVFNEIGEEIKINMKSKARIVDAAVTLFAQHGYDTITD